MKKILNNNCIFSIKKFYNFNIEDKQKLKEIILKEKDVFFKNNDKAVYTNFKIPDNIYTNNLYNKFLKLCKKQFNNFNLLKDNKKDCFSLCTNIDTYASVPHDHIKTSIINSVFYLNIPEQKGEIQFLLNKTWVNYLPEENELLIFPNYLIHNTTHNKTLDYRISINMEIKCDFDWATYERI